ncbi:unnamed protein product [Schistocephalus solidus]|uniref:Coatomer subunit zeta n=1 Tax=Schistocephalus solidus TaxID=70667 RepID=A0A183TSB9_SCHSO|nr:unnamed protein product [Schistocephalus solidus]
MPAVFRSDESEEFDIEPTLYAIKAILILDILRQHIPHVEGSQDKQNFLWLGANCVHRSSSDIFFYVIGDANENELILMSALTCLHDSISHILRGNIEKKPLMDNLDLVFLAVDELCDGGIILECDSTALASRVGFKSEDMSISEQTMSQVSCNSLLFRLLHRGFCCNNEVYSFY